MAPSVQIVCSFALTFGIPMALGVREYWTLSPSRGHLPPHEPVAPEPTPLPDAGAGPTPWAGKQLPDCLIPKPARIRELA
jgi:hypothetical protein